MNSQPVIHRPSSFADLPYDMQTILLQFLEEYDCPSWEELPLQHSMLPLVQVDVEPLARVVESFEWDDRGQEHVNQMARSLQASPHALPPIIVGPNQSFMDGRHRLLAARMIGLEKLQAIDFPAWVESVAPGARPRRGRGMAP